MGHVIFGGGGIRNTKLMISCRRKPAGRSKVSEPLGGKGGEGGGRSPITTPPLPCWLALCHPIDRLSCDAAFCVCVGGWVDGFLKDCKQLLQARASLHTSQFGGEKFSTWTAAEGPPSSVLAGPGPFPKPFESGGNWTGWGWG